MNVRKTSKPKPVPFSVSILISAGGFLVSVFCTYYYLHFIQGNVAEQVSQQVFYLILILFGISASAIIFGVMNSIGTLKGEYPGTKYYLTGPIVGVVLVVLGGFWLPHSEGKGTLSIRISGRVTDPDEVPIPDVMVMVDGTPFSGKSITDGSYAFTITDYSVGDVIQLVSSNKAYKDKTKSIKLERQEMNNMDFVLQRLQH